MPNTDNVKSLTKLCLYLHLSYGALAQADERSVKIEIPPGTLQASLQQVANRFNVSYSIDPKLASSISNAQVSGVYSLPKILALLVKDSQLEYQLLDSGFVIYRAESKVKPSQIEEVLVNGSRQSTVRSVQIKQREKAISEAVSIAELVNVPNTNVAESLQYTSGISITREAGQGRQVSIRASLPDFSLVTLNGMPVLANNDSPKDSQGQKQRDRSFDFNILPAELFKDIQVFKAYSSSQLPGGIAGTMALKTKNPSDDKGLQISVRPELGYNQYLEGASKSISGLLSNTWGEWGALVSLAYSDRTSLEQGANTFRWRNIAITEADLSALTPLEANKLQQGEYIIPRGNRYSVWQFDQQRLGANLSLEYKNSRTQFDFDLLSGFLDSHRAESHLYPRGEESTPIINGLTAISEIESNAKNELVYASYQNAIVAAESRTQHTKTSYLQGLLSFSHELSNRHKVSGILGRELASYSIPYGNKVYITGQSDVTIDYRHSPYYADIQYAENLQNADLWQMHHADIEAYESNTEYSFAKLDFQYLNKQGLDIWFGADWTEFSNVMLRLNQDDILFSELNSGPQQLIDLPSNLIVAQNKHKQLNWLRLKTSQTLSLYGLDPYNVDNNPYEIITDSEQVDERSWGVYTLFNYQTLNWETQLGIRYQSESLLSRIQAPDDAIEYKLWLPTFNASYFLNHDWRLRLGLSKNYSKPLLETLSFASPSDSSTDVRVAFNSKLRPYLSYNTDLALEKRINQNSFINFSVYYKWLDDYIVITQVPDDKLADFNTSRDSLIWQSNAETAYQWGSELSMNYKFKNSYWGVAVQAAYNQGEVTYYNASNGAALFKKNLPFLSKITASSMFFYEHPKLGFRLASVYRDRYIFKVGNALVDEDESGFLPTLYWDASAYYQIADQWKLKLNLFNISNEQERQYSHSTLRAYNTTTSGRSVVVGLSYQF